MAKNNNDRYLRAAKKAVVDLQIVFDGNIPLKKKDLYIVWFAKTLNNWKALVSTDLVDGYYFEVTHNGTTNETYVDTYKKCMNRTFTNINL